MNNCCRRIELAISRDNIPLNVTGRGQLVIDASDERSMEVLYCPFCGMAISDEQTVPTLPDSDVALLTALEQCSSIEELTTRFQAPDEVLMVENGTAIQYRFEKLLSGGQLFIIARENNRWEFVIEPSS